MHAVNGIYDGEHIIPLENVSLTKNQKVIINVLDEIKKTKKRVDFSKYKGIGAGVWDKDPQEFINELRSNDRLNA